MTDLTPVDFKYSSAILKGRAIERDLPVYLDTERYAYISKWKLSFWDAWKLLFSKDRSLWLIIYGKQPPVMLRRVSDKELFSSDKKEG